MNSDRNTGARGWMRAVRGACVMAAAAGALVSAMMTGGCSKNEDVEGWGVAFESPEKAADALVDGLRARDRERVRLVLGEGATELLDSDDPVGDRERIIEFVDAYMRGHEIEKQPDGSAIVVVGDQRWPMPIPLVKHGGGWRYDLEAGKEEVLNRRIGRNELTAIETSRAIVDAQREYYELMRASGRGGEYARRFVSDGGMRNGLYWPSGMGEGQSPLGPIVNDAVERGQAIGTGNRTYSGYVWRILEAQGPSAPGGEKSYVDNGRLTGGFGVIAYPAAYGESGIMTFMTGRNGVVYQADLGEATASLAEQIDAFDPDERWSVVEGEPAEYVAGPGNRQ